MAGWSREVLKARAKEILKRSYWMILVVCLINGVLGGGVGSVTSSFSGTLSNLNSNSPQVESVAVGVILIMALFVLCIALAFSIFVSNVLRVGLCRYMLEAQQGKTDINTLFWGFREGRYMKIVKTMFFYGLYISLWSLLFIIPGIVKSYEYFYVPYILADNPDLPTEQVLKISGDMTNGEKGQIFILTLSFIGWILLGILACGIGVLFVTPYIEATYVELYTFARWRYSAPPPYIP